MTYDQFKEQWLSSQGNPATGYDVTMQEGVIVFAYIEHLKDTITKLWSKPELTIPYTSFYVNTKNEYDDYHHSGVKFYNNYNKPLKVTVFIEELK